MLWKKSSRGSKRSSLGSARRSGWCPPVPSEARAWGDRARCAPEGGIKNTPSSCAAGNRRPRERAPFDYRSSCATQPNTRRMRRLSIDRRWSMSAYDVFVKPLLPCAACRLRGQESPVRALRCGSPGSARRRRNDRESSGQARGERHCHGGVLRRWNAASLAMNREVVQGRAENAFCLGRLTATKEPLGDSGQDREPAQHAAPAPLPRRGQCRSNCRLGGGERHKRSFHPPARHSFRSGPGWSALARS